MRSLSASLVLAVLLAATPSVAAAAERFEDAAGDVVGDAPDIVAVTIEEAEYGPLFSISVEFAEGREFGTDMETYTDVVFVSMSGDPAEDDRGILASTYTTGTHGVTLPEQLEVGAMLDTPADLWWQVVDVAQDGPVLTFTLDRKLIGSPRDLYVQVLSGTEREGQDESDEMEGDTCPELGEPPIHVRLGTGH